MSEVSVLIELPNKENKSVKLSLINGKLEVSQNGEVFFSRTLENPTKESEMFWTVEDGVIELVLKKREMEIWKKLFVGDEEIDTADIDVEPITDLSVFDDETRMQIMKMMSESKHRGY